MAAFFSFVSHHSLSSTTTKNDMISHRSPLALLYKPNDAMDIDRTSRRRLSRQELRRPSLASSSHSHSSHNDENTPAVSLPPQHQQNLYDNLATFSFGAPPAATAAATSRQLIAPWDDAGDDDLEDDNDLAERARDERAKMRAIDDGTRRPSLPSNIPTDQMERRPSQPINIPAPRGTSPSNGDTGRAFANSNSPLTAWPRSVSGSPPMSPDSDSPVNIDTSPEPESNALAGYDLSYILSGASTVDSTPARPQLPQPSAAAPFLFPFTSNKHDARRPSTASVLSDGDAFVMHLHGNDREYSARRRQWSFRRRDQAVRQAVSPPIPGKLNTKKSETSLSTAGKEKSQLWECVAVGKFDVTRVKVNKDDSGDFPQPRRLIIRPHYSPPTPSPSTPTSANPLLGASSHRGSSSARRHARQAPTTLIHKHSRANAFSIFRAPGMRFRSSRSAAAAASSGRGAGEGGQLGGLSMSHCVLLAPLKVQVHYYETRSTRALMTYDFLEEEIKEDRASDRESTRGKSSRSMERSQTSSVGTTTSSSGTIRDSEMRPSSSSSVSTSRPELNLTTEFGGRGGLWRSTSLSPVAQGKSPLGDEDDDAPSPSSTYSSHRYHQIRASFSPPQLGFRPEPVPVEVEVARVRQSKFGTALKRAFAVTPPPAANGGIQIGHGTGHGDVSHHHSHSGSHSSHKTEDGAYIPPWLSLPPRAQQEKNERTLHQLNKSFEDVGLLPHRKKPSSGGAGTSHSATSGGVSIFKRALRRRNSSATGDAFEEIPADSPVMLLPMWAAEDSIGPPSPDGKGKMLQNSIPLHERRYLLIYYVPFSEASPNKKGERKRAREGRTTAATIDERSSGDKEKERPYDKDVLTAFRVVAKVLSYDDVRTSGLRLPNEGIEVTQPSNHSSTPTTHAFPQNRTLPVSNFGDTMVIAVCPTPESGIEFVPEGLDKLGLCYRTSGTEDMPISSLAEPTEAERLSPVGRAIVEMAWCGCLSVMGIATAP